MLRGQLTLRAGNFLLDSGEFEIETTGVTALFGRSGSGKSLLLRAIAGLDAHIHGHLQFDAERWQDGRWRLPTSRRDIGFVFQDAALFPHLDVRGNLDYARRRAPGATAASVAAIAEEVGIAHKLDQDVGSLSGGERQRVAIARALVSRPRLLFMDEPLSALDWRAKGELLGLIETLAASTGVPILYITHAPIEVERLADRVVFMADGRIERIETLREALARPDSPLFEEEGPVSVLEGDLGAPADNGLHPFVTPAARLWLVGASGRRPGAARLRILARDVALALDAPGRVSILNQLPVTVERVEPEAGGRVTVVCRLGDGQVLLAQITAWSARTLALAPGAAVFALIKSVALMD
ncbi:MAG TPA: molybdenum ABC transporter ATP-binding protein [Rhodocyclaceae bacterium]|nr:molybdenum ABC transporter ATP-binding protein [Rhodocyclaceae bacterium]